LYGASPNSTAAASPPEEEEDEEEEDEEEEDEELPVSIASPSAPLAAPLPPALVPAFARPLPLPLPPLLPPALPPALLSSPSTVEAAISLPAVAFSTSLISLGSTPHGPSNAFSSACQWCRADDGQTMRTGHMSS